MRGIGEGFGERDVAAEARAGGAHHRAFEVVPRAVGRARDAMDLVDRPGMLRERRLLRVVQVFLAKLIADVDQLQHREQPEPFVPRAVEQAEIADCFGAGLLRGGLFGLRGAAFFGVRHVGGSSTLP